MSKRGFASLSQEQRIEIAAKGGRAAHKKGVAHVFSSEEAREAGRRGGLRTIRDREHMAAIGRKGGHTKYGTEPPVDVEDDEQ